MNNEINYTNSVNSKHIKDFGQYFTNYTIAEFMCCWACKGAKTMLDPAVGNSVFFQYTKKHYPQCSLVGYEIDGEMLRYFGNPFSADIRNEDYLLNGWNEKYDAIVCNPPYNRFQAVRNRSEILDAIYEHTGIKYSGYANLYILFLLKSIHQLSDTGRLAYIIPSEFLNSKYGTAVKQLLIDKKLLRAIINFENDHEVFFNSITTCCILLLDRAPKEHAAFYNLSSVDELQPEILETEANSSNCVEYKKLRSAEKWRSFIYQEPVSNYTNLKPISSFCSVSRGIATGANDYFCFSLSKADRFGIPERCLSKCICHSADIKVPIFKPTDFDNLSNDGKTVYLLDIASEDCEAVKSYIELGKKNGIDKKYLPSHRSPWYSMEQKPAAPIWVSSACRDNIKFIRNIAMIKSLTTFHSIFVNRQYCEDTDLIFCYYLTPIAQKIIRENRKELGNGLKKFQPNDLNSAKMIDINIISSDDRAKILTIFKELMHGTSDAHILQLNSIFSSYLM